MMCTKNSSEKVSVSMWKATVHDSTVRNSLNMSGVFGELPRRKPLLSAENMAAQIRFTKLHLNKVLWTNKTMSRHVWPQWLYLTSAVGKDGNYLSSWESNQRLQNICTCLIPNLATKLSYHSKTLFLLMRGKLISHSKKKKKSTARLCGSVIVKYGTLTLI